ncbi:MAG: ABC-2 transporter permease [Ruminiclostridium sp.]|nr:ABC-2 transporter permease [Ruminiclostridium sp.]
MKALLYKDFLLLWKQGRSFFLWAILLSLLSYRLLDGRLAVLNGMILLFFLLMVPADLGADWLAPLPLSPKVRVWSKYLQLWLLVLGELLLVLAASAVSPSEEITQEVLVTALVYGAVTLALQAFFFPVLAMFGPASKGAWYSYTICCFLGYFVGLIPLGLVRESPLAVTDVLPYVGILWVTSVISAFLAVDQYRKAWWAGKMS